MKVGSSIFKMLFLFFSPFPPPLHPSSQLRIDCERGGSVWERRESARSLGRVEKDWHVGWISMRSLLGSGLYRPLVECLNHFSLNVMYVLGVICLSTHQWPSPIKSDWIEGRDPEGGRLVFDENVKCDVKFNPIRPYHWDLWTLVIELLECPYCSSLCVVQDTWHEISVE